ncbi:MAG: IMP cyclohydrolase [Nanoarchaeota archaeon]
MTQELEALVQMEYPGRFIIVGKSIADETIVCYGVTGRSPSSQTRTFGKGNNTYTIRTQVTDMKQLETGSPALLIYPAIAFHQNAVVASNGAQTKLLYTELRINMDLEHSPEMLRDHPGMHRVFCNDVMNRALEQSFYEYDEKQDRWIDLASYEPDDPNFTPRINLVTLGNQAALSVIGKRDQEPYTSQYEIILQPGL